MSDQEQGNGEGSTPEYTASKRKSPPVVTNDGSVRDELSAPEKLRIGGFAAPILRAAAKDGRSRRKVNVVGKDGSVRESTLGEVQQGLIVAHGLEFEVAEKTPETTYACRVCAREFVWKGPARVPLACNDCRGTCKCACGNRIGAYALTPKAVAQRNGAPPRCKQCSQIDRRKPIPQCACGAELSAHSRKHEQEGRTPVCSKCYLATRRASARTVTCRCGNSVGSRSMSPSSIARRNGALPVCRACSTKRLNQGRSAR